MQEEGCWEGREKTTKKGLRTVRGNGDKDNDYSPTHPELEVAAALSDSDTAIPFTFGSKQAVETLVRYTKLAFDAFAHSFLLVLVH